MTVKKPIDPRALAAIYANAYASDAASFGPGNPPVPANPDAAPRIYEYRPGENLVYIPRSGYGLVDFQTLRNLADASKEIRLNIELIKRQVRGLEYQITDVDTGQTAKDVNPEIRAFMESPDGEHDIDAWINMLLEELLVTDAVTLYPRMRTGDRVELIDGTTIVPLLDYRGRIPDPPMPAYLQVLYGSPSSWYTREQLLYRPLNTAVYSPYGKSPIESILAAVNLALRRDQSRIKDYSEGNVPAAFAGLPSDWTAEQIREFTEYFNALIEGKPGRRGRVLFLPHEGSGTPVHEFNRYDADKVELDTWLMQLACWAFGNSPSEFGLTPGEGLGGKGFAEGGESTQYRSQIGPIAKYLARLFNQIFKILGRPDLRLVWSGLEPIRDRSKMAAVDQAYVAMGVYDVGYIQNRDGIPPEYRPEAPPAGFNPQLGGDAAIYAEMMPYLQRAVRAELATWRTQARRDLKRRGRIMVFRTELIPEEMYQEIAVRLQRARTVEQVDAAFRRAQDIARNAPDELRKMIAPAREVGGTRPFRVAYP